MPREIERKFIVANNQWKQLARPADTEDIVQGYIRSPDATVRVRISTNVMTLEESAFITIKSKRAISDDRAIDRREWEHPIPVHEAREMIEHVCDTKIKKRRYHLAYEGKEWTVDVLLKPRYHGLALAEIELTKATEEFALPGFVTAASEVTKDERFTNRYLADKKNDFDYLKKSIAKAEENSLNR